MTFTPRQDETRILVVDDHLISSRYTMAALRQSGCAVKRARSAREALLTALKWRPRVIFMDINLPDGNGLDLIGKIRDAWPDKQYRPRFVILSAGDHDAFTSVAADPGVDRLLIKPASTAKIQEAARIQPIDEKTEPPQPSHVRELQQLFVEEIERRLPELDRCISALDWSRSAAILHQMIASSAMCGERRIESDLRRLANRIRDGNPALQAAGAYYALLESTREFTDRVGLRSR